MSKSEVGNDLHQFSIMKIKEPVMNNISTINENKPFFFFFFKLKSSDYC